MGQIAAAVSKLIEPVVNFPEGFLRQIAQASSSSRTSRVRTRINFRLVTDYQLPRKLPDRHRCSGAPLAGRHPVLPNGHPWPRRDLREPPGIDGRCLPARTDPVRSRPESAGFCIADHLPVDYHTFLGRAVLEIFPKGGSGNEICCVRRWPAVGSGVLSGCGPSWPVERSFLLGGVWARHGHPAAKIRSEPSSSAASARWAMPDATSEVVLCPPERERAGPGGSSAAAWPGGLRPRPDRRCAGRGRARADRLLSGLGIAWRGGGGSWARCWTQPRAARPAAVWASRSRCIDGAGRRPRLPLTRAALADLKEPRVHHRAEAARRVGILARAADLEAGRMPSRSPNWFTSSRTTRVPLPRPAPGAEANSP